MYLIIFLQLLDMFLSPIYECEVISVVNGCKSKTSTNCDDIDFRLIKSVIISIVKPITHIFNLSFQTETFPEKMKIAKVIPLYKSGSKNDLNNYRPIVLLPQLSKILEKLYSNRLNTFTKTCDIESLSVWVQGENVHYTCTCKSSV